MGKNKWPIFSHLYLNSGTKVTVVGVGEIGFKEMHQFYLKVGSTQTSRVVLKAIVNFCYSRLII